MAQAIPRGYGSQCQGGAGVRGFSRSGKPRLLLSLIPVGRSFPTRPSFCLALQWVLREILCSVIFSLLNFNVSSFGANLSLRYKLDAISYGMSFEFKRGFRWRTGRTEQGQTKKK